MSSRILPVSVVTVLVLAAAASLAARQAKPAASDEATIKLALSAAPADVASKAAVVDHGADGKPRQLRAGTNNFVCMAHPEVMCIDKQWQEWADAWMNKRAPKVAGVGIAYMLAGDREGGSNTDPYATKPSPTNQWVKSPAHIMVLTSDPRQLDSLPTDPMNGGPWVMWKGTPYAHLMVPTVPMPKGAIMK